MVKGTLNHLSCFPSHPLDSDKYKLYNLRLLFRFLEKGFWMFTGWGGWGVCTGTCVHLCGGLRLVSDTFFDQSPLCIEVGSFVEPGLGVLAS